MDIKPIETRYKGYHFRSRLEARWAVFFDSLKMEWEYEAEGYEIGGSDEFDEGPVRYLPDFHLIDPRDSAGVYAEVKGTNEMLENKRSEYEAIFDFNSPIPGMMNSYDDTYHTRGVILLGPIPEPNWGITLHPIIQHHKGLIFNWIYFIAYGGCINRGWIEKFHFSNELGYFIDCPSGPDEWCIDYKYIATPRSNKNVIDSYKAARSARFEHGETGAT